MRARTVHSRARGRDGGVREVMAKGNLAPVAAAAQAIACRSMSIQTGALRLQLSHDVVGNWRTILYVPTWV
jgi:hypothetical protein